MTKLAKDSLKGGVFFILVMAAVIFLPAGTFKYWQAWVYLFIFGTACLLITLYLLKYDRKLLESRISVGVKAEQEKSQKIIQGFASVFVTLILVVSGFDHRFGWSHPSNLTVFLADILVFLGFYIIFVVFKENSFTAATVKVDKEQKVISTGLYSKIRHPMYFGALLLFIATPIALGSYWGVLFAIPLTLTLILRLFNEEKYLSKNLKGYKEYCQKVKKHLVPFVW